jgi:PAS domain S-box-containing protein
MLPVGDTLFDHAACGLVLTDTSGMILRANTTACIWLGYGEEELVGKLRMLDLLPLGARLFHQTHCLPVLQAQGSVAEIQFDLRNQRQERIPMLVNITRQRMDGRLVDHWALFKTVDRRAYERELLAARKAAEAALDARRGAEVELQRLNTQLSMAHRRKDEFLATLSHELREPLAPIRSALDVLHMKFGQGPELPVLDVFDRQLRHLTRLVDDLTDASRITQGRMQLRRAPVELSALVHGAAQDMAPLMQAARHTFTSSIAPAPIVIDGDATRLSQVVTNLLTNAAQYTPDGGRIDLQLAREDGMAVIRVRDSGIGIPSAAHGKIFDMFAQLEPAHGRTKQGLGIGLALVHSVVTLHGGSIVAASAGPGRGSTFTVRLPLTN